LMNRLGFAFAVTSYPENGLVVTRGIEDLTLLAAYFRDLYPNTRRIFLVGVSEGGLIATKAVETYPQIFKGGVAACGPIGDFRQQVSWFGDFRVLFDYFFPEVFDFSPVVIPPQAIVDWQTVYSPTIPGLLASNPLATQQLLNVSRAPVDPADPATIPQTVLELLWYNIFATMDAQLKLQGQPFDNQTRIYMGSLDDEALNAGVQRFSADPLALQNIDTYLQTTGRLRAPLVTLHTTGDPIVPYSHMALYRLKVLKSGSFWNYNHIPVQRYGHCAFKAPEALVAFALMYLKASWTPLRNAEDALVNPADQAEYLRLAREWGALQEDQLFLPMVARP
jgi:pimeloyl-ACP methyl ester carboxylesterase